MSKILTVLILAGGLAGAQIAFPTTTLTADTKAQSWFPLQVASTANIFSAWNKTTILVVGHEAVCVNLVIGKYVSGNRGCQGSATADHLAGTVVYAGPPTYFHPLPPKNGVAGGACVAATYAVLPWIVLNAGGAASIWNCTANAWVVS